MRQESLAVAEGHCCSSSQELTAPQQGRKQQQKVRLLQWSLGSPQVLVLVLAQAQGRHQCQMLELRLRHTSALEQAQALGQSRQRRKFQEHRWVPLKQALSSLAQMVWVLAPLGQKLALQQGEALEQNSEQHQSQA